MLVQWGLSNRILGYGDQRSFNRDTGDAGYDEFRAVIQDDERRRDISTLFLGEGFDSNGVEIKTQNGNSVAVGGFYFNGKEEDTLPHNPGILFDEFGRFDLTDAHGNAVFSDTMGLTLKTRSTTFIETGDMFGIKSAGLVSIRAKTGNHVYGNLSLVVGGDSYAETIAAEHLVVREGKYEDTASSLSTNVPFYQWKIDPSSVAQIKMEIDKIEFGNDTSQSNFILETSKATLGKDTMIGMLTSEPATFKIGNSSAQVPMEMKVNEVKFGTGTVDVELSIAKNTIKHAVANVVDAAQNFFGTDYLSITEPMLKGRSTATFLTTLISNIIAIGSATTTIATSLGTHTHAVTGGLVAFPSVDGGIAGGIAAGIINSSITSLSSQAVQAVVPGKIMSLKNFTG